VDVLRGVDNQLDNLLRGVGGAVLRAVPGGAARSDQGDDEAARALVLEAVDVIEQARCMQHSTRCAPCSVWRVLRVLPLFR
jgi:hypothetical protein